MKNLCMQFINEEDGATLVEYGILVALIAAVVVGLIAALGGQVNTGFQQTSDALADGGIAVPE